MEWKTVEFQNLYAESSRNGLYKSKEFHGIGIRIVNMKELFAFPIIGEQEMQLLEVTDSELNKFGLQPGDLLFARRSLVEEGSGKCVLVVEHKKSPIIFESSIIRVRLNKNICLPLFYYYYFRSPIGRLGIQSIITGAGQKGIRGTELARIPVYHPPLTEQKAIAQSLSDVDAQITALDQLITKKRNIKQSTMQQLLTGKKRLPGFSKDGDGVVRDKKIPECYKQTEVGMIPNDWEVVLLDSVAKRGSGHTPDKKHPEYWNGEIKWISLKDSNLLDNLYIEDTAEKITRAGIANSSAVLHPLGSVVLSRDAGVGKSAITKDVMAVSQHFMAWHCGSQLDNHFLYYWLQAEKSEFERIAIGNTIKTIGLSYFKQLKIPFPSLPEQKAIAQVLSDMDAEIEGLEQKRDKYKAIKQGIMQELLTGKTRLISSS